MNIKVPVLFYTLYLNSGVSRGVEEEIVVNVNIADENDNAPEFLTLTREIVGSVDSRAELGERVAKVEAWDPDVGLNADLRYFVHGAGADRFSIGAKGRYLSYVTSTKFSLISASCPFSEADNLESIQPQLSF